MNTQMLVEPSFYEVLRSLASSGSDRARRVTAGNATTDARQLVKDRDALVDELRVASEEAARWRSIAEKLA